MAKPMKLEEKRAKMLEVFEKHKTFFKMQELEKIGSKEKGVIENTVKDVILSLLYDDLITGEKVGTSIFYWSNNTKALLKAIKETKKLQDEILEYERKTRKCEIEIEEGKKNKQFTEERIFKMDKLSKETNKLNEFNKELEEYSTLSRDEYEIRMKDINFIVSDINKDTDNLFIILDYVSKKFNMDKKDVYKSFNISEDMDYV